MKKELVAPMLMLSMPNMLNNRHLVQKHWTYKRKRLRPEKISQKNKRNAISEGDEFSSYGEVWCQSEGEGDITMELKEKLEESEFKIQMTMRGR